MMMTAYVLSANMEIIRISVHMERQFANMIFVLNAGGKKRNDNQHAEGQISLHVSRIFPVLCYRLSA